MGYQRIQISITCKRYDRFCTVMGKKGLGLLTWSWLLGGPSPYCLILLSVSQHRWLNAFGQKKVSSLSLAITRDAHCPPMIGKREGLRLHPHRKKKLFDFPSPAGMLLTKLSLGGNNDVKYKLFPPRESLVSDIPAGDGNIEKLFLRWMHVHYLNWRSNGRKLSSTSGHADQWVWLLWIFCW